MDNLPIELKISNLLSSSNLTISIAESCTAGGIASRICSVPGSSSYFLGGIIAYSNKIKINELNICEKDLDKYSAVSPKICTQMSEGIRSKFGSDISISSTGYLGPMGDDPGRVFIGISDSQDTFVQEYKFFGERLSVLDLAIDSSLSLLLSKIK